MSILDDLKAIQAEAEEGLKNAGSLEALEQIRIAVMGKKGSLTAAMKGMGKLAPEERPQVGKLANEVRASVEAALAARKAELEKAVLAAKISADATAWMAFSGIFHSALTVAEWKLSPASS